MPCRTVAAKQNNIVLKFFGQFPQKYIGTGCITPWKYQEKAIPRQRVHRAIGVSVFSNVLTGYCRPNTFFTPTILGLIDSAKSSFILKHQPHRSPCGKLFQSLDFGINFFEASIASPLAFFGCLLLGITLRHP